ncbi:MAG: PAC2 family protein [Actinomycetota bacterium]
MPRYRLIEPGEPLVAPALVAAFDGWVDAGGAASAAAQVVAEGGRPVVTFDPDDLYDYRSRRPVLDIVDGTMRNLVWPDLAIQRVRRGGRDLLVLTGPEPDFRWKELGSVIADLALRLGVLEWVSLGAIPSQVPHTRPVPILATASEPGLLHNGETPGPPGLMRVPSAALSALESIANGSGIRSVGYYAQIPHYVGGPYARATIALLESVGRHLGLGFPLDALVEEADAQAARLDLAVAADEDSKEYVERLESGGGDDEEPELRVPSGDELAAEIERFLRGEQGEDPGRGR